MPDPKPTSPLRKTGFARMRTWQLVLLVLIAGWVPSLLMTFLAYSYVSGAFQQRIRSNELNVVRTIARLVEVDLGRTAEVVEYYQTLPKTRAMALQPPGQALQDWLASIYYSHPRIDGMFLTDAEGRLLASLPYDGDIVGRDFNSRFWLHEAAEAPGAWISAVFPRQPDQRLNSAIVVAVRNQDGTIAGYLGASVLVERVGKRLAALNLTRGGITQVIDQNGFPLFDEHFMPNAFLTPIADSDLVKRFHENPSGNFQWGEFLYTFSEVEPAKWVAVFEQPKSDANSQVIELLTRITLLAAWLIVGTTLVAWAVARLYRQQDEDTEHLERANLLNENILANIPVGIAQIDPERRVVLQGNHAFREIASRCGSVVADEQVEGLPLARFPFVSTETVDQLLQGGTSFAAREQQATGPDGQTYYHVVNLIRLQDSHRRTQGLLLIVEDQTPDVSLRRELIQANTAKDQFMAVLSHELRNPLSPVITAVAELEDTHGSDADARRALDVIRRNVELEARLIDDLLDVTRIANRKLQLHLETVDAHELIRRTVEICQRDISEKMLQVNLELGAARRHVRADPARLQQVFWNLIKNAVKFTPECRGITIRTGNRDGRFVAEVEDQGIGIPRDKLERIFNAFEQGETAITRHFGGLGLGLAISRAMVVAHGGTLAASSDGEGKGATFKLSLDTVEPKLIRETRRIAPTQLKPVDMKGHRVLLVDDHADTSRGLARLLARRGLEVRTAANAAEALDWARKERFDLVLSDIGLPDKSGFELMSELRVRHNLKGIALSGFGMESDVEKSEQAGFTVHLTKPVNIERLDEALRSLLQL